MTKRFRPTFWATVVTLPVLFVLLAFGTWQIQRLEWKNTLIENRATRITNPPIPVAALAGVRDGRVDDAGVALLEYMPVDLRGTYVTAEPMRLMPRIRDGMRGFHVVALFEADAPLGMVLVDRGWAPIDARLGTMRPPTGLVRVEGFLRLFVTPGPFVPSNEPDANNWFFMDEAAMLAASGMPTGVPAGFYVQAGPNASGPTTYPSGAVPKVNLRNSHLEYAVTWYLLALVLAVIFVIFHWRRDET